MIYFIVLGSIIFAAYRLYGLFKVPQELKDIPAAPLMTFVRYIKDKRSFGDKVDEYFQSQLNEFGAIRVNISLIQISYLRIDYISRYSLI
jgi:hypothetical protein